MDGSISYDRQGAKAQSRHVTSPRACIQQLIETNPKSRQEKLLRLFITEARRNDTMLEAALEYCFTNNYMSLLRGMKEAQKPDEVREAEAKKEEEIRATLKERHAEKVRDEGVRQAQEILMNLQMPNGKRLRNCTFKECERMGKKQSHLGAFLTAISDLGKPAETVGKTLTESRLSKVYKSVG